jgi:hypothetical protein
MHRVAAMWSKMTGTPRPHRGTLIRWATKGVKGHRLHAELLGGRWYATPEAVADFHRHMTRPPDGCIARAAGPSRTAQIQASLAELDGLIARNGTVPVGIAPATLRCPS